MRQWTVDAFAAQPFRGNPACVVEPMEAWPADAWMQALAAENNQAETAFLLRTADPGRFGLRWFTPTMEVPLCGHATLASGHVLLAELAVTASSLVFETRSGPLTVTRAGDGYEMDFPARPPRRIAAPGGLAEALGVEPQEVWAANFLIAILADEAQVRGLAPDLAALRDVGEALDLRGNVGVAALAAPGAPYDVTGSSRRRPAFPRTRRPDRCTASSRRCSPTSSGAPSCGSIRPIRDAAATSSARRPASG